MQITKQRLIEIIKEEIANLSETGEEAVTEEETVEEETVEENADVEGKIAQIEEKLNALKASLK